jgi:hypothetical protein
MSEHVHLLFSEPQQSTLADAIKSLKQGGSRRLIGGGSTSGKALPALAGVGSAEILGWEPPALPGTPLPQDDSERT